MLSVGILSLGHTKLIFIDPVVKANGSYYWLTTQSGAGVPRRQPHRRSGLATLPSVGAIP